MASSDKSDYANIGKVDVPVHVTIRQSDYANASGPSSVNSSIQNIPAAAVNARDRDDLRSVRSKRSQNKKQLPKVLYSVDESPPWYLCILLGLQHYIIMFGATVTYPLVLSNHLCVGEDNVAKSQIIGTVFFVAGICTLLQTVVGNRLPIVQSASFTFIAPSIAILSLDIWKCPQDPKDVTTPCGRQEIATTLSPIVDNGTFSNATMPADEGWMSRMRELQGAIMVASVFQVVIGLSGALGWLVRFVGPLAIAPTISLIGLALLGAAGDFASKQWWIALVTVLLIVAFSQYSVNINIPCFVYSRERGCEKLSLPLFRLFPVILAVSITWLICIILTVAGVFPSADEWKNAKADVRIDVLTSAPFFRIPYPGQWGLPTVSLASVFGMLAAVIGSMVESIGDYYACARLSGIPSPPMHAVNRGILVEGIGCVLSGAFGTGSGTTSYSENIAAIGITKVASLRVTQAGALIMIIFGVFGKLGGVFVTIPDPIAGGVFIVMFGMITAVGISNLQFVDLNSSRNLFIIGFSFFFGLTLPAYLQRNPQAIQTGSTALDQIIVVLLTTSMFVGGLAGFVLDNTIPGTDEERGMRAWRRQIKGQAPSTGDYADGDSDTTIYSANLRMYDIPLISDWLRQQSWASYFPFLPPFRGHACKRVLVRRPAAAPAAEGRDAPVMPNPDPRADIGNSQV